MPKKKRFKIYSISEQESKIFKAMVFDLNETAAKQILFGIIQVLSKNNTMTASFFKEILDDASKYSSIKNGG